jgi:hypothetical protein
MEAPSEALLQIGSESRLEVLNTAIGKRQQPAAVTGFAKAPPIALSEFTSLNRNACGQYREEIPFGNLQSPAILVGEDEEVIAAG